MQIVVCGNLQSETINWAAIDVCRSRSRTCHRTRPPLLSSLRQFIYTEHVSNYFCAEQVVPVLHLFSLFPPSINASHWEGGSGTWSTLAFLQLNVYHRPCSRRHARASPAHVSVAVVPRGYYALSRHTSNPLQKQDVSFRWPSPNRL